MFTLYEHRDTRGEPCFSAEHNHGGGIDVSGLKFDPYAALSDAAAWAQVRTVCYEFACKSSRSDCSPVATDGGGALVQPLLFAGASS